MSNNDNGAGAAVATDRKKIDLDAARAARRENREAPPVVVFMGEEIALPPALPADVLDLVGGLFSGDWSGVVPAVEMLLGDEQYARLRQLAADNGDILELDDITFLLTEVLDVYGVTAPESSASESSS